MKTISKIQSGIHFQAPDSRWVMKITPDRKIVINEDVEVSEAAITLIGIVNDMTKPKEWNGLTAEEIASIPLNEHTVQAVENLLRSKNK